MLRLFVKRYAGFPLWCIGFTLLYILFDVSWIIHYRSKYIFPLQPVTYNNITKTNSCHDPVYFIYPLNVRRNGIQPKLLHKNMIVSHGFKNESCSNIEGFNNITTPIVCAKYDTQLHSNAFCTGGTIIYSQDPSISIPLSKQKINKILTKYCNVYHKMDDVCKFKLLTFNMDNLQQRIEFITKYIDCTNNNSQPNKTWVLKEPKHLGNGVHFYNNHNLIYSLISRSQSEQKQYYNKCINVSTLQNSEYFKNKGLDYIPRNDGTGAYKINYNGLTMQEFIANPLLIDNKAFHIRTLLLIASNENPLIVLQHPQWQIFRNPLEYNNTDLDPFKLKSNANIAKNGPAKLVDTNGTILWHQAWGYNRFLKYLREQLNDTNLENKMQKDMKHITTSVFKARSYYSRLKMKTLHQLLMNDKTFDNILRFDIACMDTVMNDKFELKFLEINFRCGYYCDKPNSKMDTVGDDTEFCESFANETSDILMEIYAKQKNGIVIKNIRSLR